MSETSVYTYLPTPQERALLVFMEAESESRWCAGWLHDLHLELKGDPAYDWLVEQAGGYWTWAGEGEEGAVNVSGRILKWNEGKP